MVSGFINLMKEKGMTSAFALTKVKYLLRDAGIKTKIGHLGTLDPDGEGVLPIALGYATRLFNYDLEKKKVYYALFKFGVETDTLDESGIITGQNIKIPSIAEIQEAILSLVGEYEQVPPLYSAKSINGQRAYTLARKGIDFELKSKRITVYSMKLLEQVSSDVFSFRIECSSGTYVRSLARDLAALTQTLGIMKYIKRERSSYFSIEDAKTLSELAQDIKANILPIECFTGKFEKYNIDEKYSKSLYNGVKLYFDDLPEGIFSIYCCGELFGLAEKGTKSQLIVKTRLI